MIAADGLLYCGLVQSDYAVIILQLERSWALVAISLPLLDLPHKKNIVQQIAMVNAL